jgi:Ca2+/Na+ antiporter
MITTPATAVAPATEDRVAVGPIWRTGLVAGAVASIATTAIAAGARGVDIALETTQDEPIPLLGFAQVTFMAVVVGLVLASGLARRARHPRRTFTRATVALTVASCVPSVLIVAGAASILVSVLTHVVAAAIVIPAVRDRLPR